MAARFAALKCQVSESTKERARRLAERWPRFDPAVMETRFLFRSEGRDRAVEAIVSRRRRDAVVATGEGRTFREALGELDRRIGRMLRRGRERRIESRPAP